MERRALPVQGVWVGPHTPEHTHTHTHLDTPQMPSTQQLCPAVCLKGNTNAHIHSALLAAGVRVPLPIGTRLCVFGCWLWFTVLCGSPAAVLSHHGFGRVEGLVLVVLTTAPQRHSTSFVIFILNFLLICTASNPHPPHRFFFSVRGLILKLVACTHSHGTGRGSDDSHTIIYKKCSWSHTVFSVNTYIWIEVNFWHVD